MYCPPTIPWTPDAAVNSAQAGDDPRRIAALLDQHQPDRLGVERVAGQDRDRPRRSGRDRSGRPRRSESSSIAGRSSWISEYVWMSSSAPASGSTASVGIPTACAVASASTGPDPLAAREQRVAHRLLEAVRRRLRAEAQPLEVGLDVGAQVVRVAQLRTRAPAGPPRGLRVRGPDLAVELGARLGREARALLDQRGGAVGGQLARAQRHGGVLEALDQALKGLRRHRRGLWHAGVGTSRTLHRAGAQHRGEDAVHEPGRLGAAERLGGLDRLVDRALGRDRRVALDQVGVQHLQQRGAQDRALERRDAVDRPVLRVALDVDVELLGVVGRRVGERAGERRRRPARRCRRAGGWVRSCW